MSIQRRGVLLAAVIALTLSGIVAAESTPRGQLAVWAIGLPNGYVIMEHQAPAIEVTAYDVARGMIEVKGGTRIVIIITEPSDVALDFRTLNFPFRAVQVDGLGRSVAFGPAGGSIMERETPTGRHVLTVSYRFTLAPDTIPGSYAWPLSMAVRHPMPRELGAPPATPDSPHRYAKGKA